MTLLLIGGAVGLVLGIAGTYLVPVLLRKARGAVEKIGE